MSPKHLAFVSQGPHSLAESLEGEEEKAPLAVVKMNAACGTWSVREVGDTRVVTGHSRA